MSATEKREMERARDGFLAELKRAIAVADSDGDNDLDHTAAENPNRTKKKGQYERYWPVIDEPSAPPQLQVVAPSSSSKLDPKMRPGSVVLVPETRTLSR